MSGVAAGVAKVCALHAFFGHMELSRLPPGALTTSSFGLMTLSTVRSSGGTRGKWFIKKKKNTHTHEVMFWSYTVTGFFTVDIIVYLAFVM